MTVNHSFSPIQPRKFGFLQARHLLNRAGFGGTTQQINAVRDRGLYKAVKLLVNYQSAQNDAMPTPDADPDIIRPRTRQQRMILRRARAKNDEAVLAEFRAQRQTRMEDDRQQMGQLKRWWMARMIATPRPLQEQLALLWHSHFASNFRTVRDSYLMYKQNQFFRAQAGVSFANLATGIIRDPAMIRFLDNHNNRRRSPNENLARELMELFTLGEGNYTEKDIKEGARALTGYTFRDNDFWFSQDAHDDGKKNILGETGNFNGDDFVRILLRRKACATYICYKLYKHFVADLDDHVGSAAKTVILRMARQLRTSDYRLEPVLKKLFMSKHFYDPQIMGNKIKSPVQLIVGTIRMLKTPTRDLSLLVDAAKSMGQNLFDPPSVAGWSGGRSWINTSTLFVRQNLSTYLITGKLPANSRWDRDGMDYDPHWLLSELPERSPETVVDHLTPTILGGNIAPPRRAQLISFLAERNNKSKADRLIGLLLLITSMPEYQLC